MCLLSQLIFFLKKKNSSPLIKPQLKEKDPKGNPGHTELNKEKA